GAWFDGEDPSIVRLIGAGARSDVYQGPCVSEGSMNRRRDPRVGLPDLCVGPAVPLVIDRWAAGSIRTVSARRRRVFAGGTPRVGHDDGCAAGMAFGTAGSPSMLRALRECW